MLLQGLVHDKTGHIFANVTRFLMPASNLMCLMTHYLPLELPPETHTITVSINTVSHILCGIETLTAYARQFREPNMRPARDPARLSHTSKALKVLLARDPARLSHTGKAWEPINCPQGTQQAESLKQSMGNCGL